MKVEYINPFIETVEELFEKMLTCAVKRGEVTFSKEVPPNRDIVALIGLSGPARGIVALSFPVSTALAIVGRMLGGEIRVVDDSVKDGVAELVNIVAGGAKARLNADHGTPIDLSLPTVVRGNSYTVDYPSQSVWLEIPFTSDLGPFSLRVTFGRDDARKGGAQ
jgi:chemotaxis protein CheX